MAMVIAIILAVIADRYARDFAGGKVLQNLRSATWLNLYLGKGINWLEKVSIKQPYLVVLSAIVPLCIVLLVIKLLLSAILGPRVGPLLFTFGTLFYFLGTQDIEGHDSQYVVAHENSFGVLFWFAILGYSGAFLYWFLIVARQSSAIKDITQEGVRQALTLLHAIAAWIPARITGFIYALVGNFEPGFKAWLNCMRDSKLSSSQILQDCGNASANASENASATLVNRAYFAWVILIVVIVIIR